ncbi:hypothetical protein CTheo_4162 [Ceratobasidium theobromae]|uniref:Uncharacterized protein n=1 Tax=Ceratobasidium theobromae TaxID=1582974 RepID=A0A5N5QLH2_9AGAM|nr:hypothetical protein CTheo_4162 [Ceratobasidium theobromae]
MPPSFLASSAPAICRSGFNSPGLPLSTAPTLASDDRRRRPLLSEVTAISSGPVWALQSLAAFVLDVPPR